MIKFMDFFLAKVRKFFCCFMNVESKIFIPLSRKKCGCSSVGRAKASQALGRGFEPRHPLFFSKIFVSHYNLASTGSAINSPFSILHSSFFILH